MEAVRFIGSNVQPKPLSLVLIVILVAGVPLLFIGFITVKQLGGVYHTKITDHLTTLVRKHSRTIDNFLIDRLGDIRVMARSQPRENLADQVFLTKQLAILREEYSGVFVDLGLIDPKGIQQTYSGPFNLLHADYAKAAWFAETLQYQFVISDVFSGLRGSPHFIVAVKLPWRDPGWILRATVDFNAFNALVSNIKIGTTGFAYILNRAGDLQTQPRFEIDSRQGPHRRFLAADLAADQVLIAEAPESSVPSHIFAVTALNSGRWILIFQQEYADAFANWNTTKKLAIGMFIVWAAIVALFTYFISRHMTLRIEEERFQKEQMSGQVIEAGRLASIGELAAGIAHEINNPVAIMVEEAGWIQDLLAEDNPATAENLTEIERAAGQIKTQGGRCKEITHKLLSFARKTDPTAKCVNLNEMILELIALVNQKTRYANVQIETRLAPDLPPIWASATEMQQVLLNLINNSIDAMNSSGGTIRISSRDGGDGQIAIEVADNGSGIAEANLARIFDPFFTTKPVGQGTGLGLSICYGIVKKLGGDIQAQSARGQGTTFTITLPAATDQANACANDAGE